jgi:hypothetical protein
MPTEALSDNGLIEVWSALEAPLGAPEVAPAKARLTVRDAKEFRHANAGRSKFSSRSSSLIGSLFRPTAKHNNGHRRRSQAAAYDFGRTKVKEK